jgi:hypothetical protein
MLKPSKVLSQVSMRGVWGLRVAEVFAPGQRRAVERGVALAGQEGLGVGELSELDPDVVGGLLNGREPPSRDSAR